MSTSLIGIRLNDYFRLNFDQDDVEFAIPFLQEDIRLFIDPFLMWSSSNPIYRQLHIHLTDFFEHIRSLIKKGNETDALKLLLACSEPHELGLGFASQSKKGSTIGPKLANDIISMYNYIPQVNKNGINHVEEIQLVVRNISNDRISDIAYSILKGYFIKFTSQQVQKHGIPTKQCMIEGFYDFDRKIWGAGRKLYLPYNPYDNSPIVLAPTDLLRHLPWINYKDYCDSYYRKIVLPPSNTKDKMRQAIRLNKEVVLEHNRRNFNHVQNYVGLKEKEAGHCKPEPLTELSIAEQALRIANRSLMILEGQIAKYNSSLVPTHLQIDYEEKQSEVAKLEERVERLRKKSAA